MFKIIVLVCNLSIAPSNCTSQTANQILETPEFTNQLECNQPQPWLAKLANQPIPGKEYPKFICSRIKNS